MKTSTKIDSAGRLVIPKELRERYGFEFDQKIRIIPVDDGITIIIDRPDRRFVKRGPFMTIKTGSNATVEDFDVSTMRSKHLDGKTGL